MMRTTHFVLAALLTATISTAAMAEDFEISAGQITFVHDPVPPPPLPPPPVQCFAIVGTSSATLAGNDQTLAFGSGSGFAVGCAFDAPLENGAVAIFAGGIVWKSPEGNLRGTFELTDFPVFDENGLVQGVFQAIIKIKFRGGTGKYKKAKGEAVATGFDFPFGGPFGAGVFADSVEGTLTLQ